MVLLVWRRPFRAARFCLRLKLGARKGNIIPVVGTTSYNTAGQITALVRSLLNDAAGNLFTDALLIPYLNSAYRKVQRALENVQAGSQLSDDALLVVPAIAVDPAARVAITDSAGPAGQLPSDLLVPLRLWERPNASNSDFIEMLDLTNQSGLPSEPQTAALRYWEWRADGIYLLGATQDTQIRLRYRRALPDLIDGTSAVLIRNAQDALAYFTAGLASVARGAPQAARWDDAGVDALEDLLNRVTQREQSAGHRRRPYGTRSLYR
jgi:hypothetical protein